MTVYFTMSVNLTLLSRNSAKFEPFSSERGRLVSRLGRHSGLCWKCIPVVAQNVVATVYQLHRLCITNEIKSNIIKLRV
jgi:hypothetical protein